MNNDCPATENIESDVSDNISVEVITPNLSVEAAIRRTDADGDINASNISAIGYPKFLFDYRCSLKRSFLSNRKVPVSITVDGITGGRLRNDTYPEIKSQNHSTEALLRPRLTRDDAVEYAHSVIRKYISFHYPTYIIMSGMPETEIVRESMAYCLYWLVPETTGSTNLQTVSIINSVSGEVVEDNVVTDRNTESDIIHSHKT